VEKWSCHLIITDALSDNSMPSEDINSAHVVVHFCLSWQNLAMRLVKMYARLKNRGWEADI